MLHPGHPGFNVWYKRGGKTKNLHLVDLKFKFHIKVNIQLDNGIAHQYLLLCVQMSCNNGCWTLLQPGGNFTFNVDRYVEAGGTQCVKALQVVTCRNVYKPTRDVDVQRVVSLVRAHTP